MSFPLGTHRARPVDCALGMTSTKKEQIGVMLEHVETGERITWYGMFTDATFERTIESLRYLGWAGSDLSDFANGLPAGVENEVEIVTEDEEYEGKLRRKVRWINGGGGVAVKDVLDDTQARAFSARMKSRVAALQAVKGAVPKPAASTTKRPTPTQRQGQAVAGALANQREDQGNPYFDDNDIDIGI